MNQGIKPKGKQQSALEKFKAFTAFEPYGRWIRGLVGGETIVDCKETMLLWRDKYLFAVYCFHKEDVQMEKLRLSKKTRTSHQFGEVIFYDLQANGTTIENAAWEYTDPKGEWQDLKGLIMFEWNSMEQWFEESEEVFVHARDPYHRVDALPSSRKVEVKIAGQIVAESDRAMFLFETGLPARYYLPKEDVRMDLLAPTELQTRCPYKGVASYWSVTVGDQTFKDIVWGYTDPIEECPKIKDLVCFYNEKVEAIYVDGVEVAKAKTPWS